MTNNQRTRLICSKCLQQMYVKEAGAYVLESTEGALEPKKVFSADVWACPTCDTEVVAGFGIDPIASQHDIWYRKVMEDARTARSSEGRSMLYEYRIASLRDIEFGEEKDNENE